jgi:hypothetical protein
VFKYERGDKNREQLILELADMRQQISELEELKTKSIL